MANELVHGTVGVSMTQAEFEAVGLHVCNSQATGDVIYASSATQLTRLGIGATNAILTVIGGVPTWQTSLSGLTFVAPALGAATATSINGLIITTTAGTLTIANSASAALVTSGNYSITLTATAATNVTLPTTGTLATLAGTEELDSKTLDSSVGKGTWTASGTWTLPAWTAGGTITLNNQVIANAGNYAVFTFSTADRGIKIQNTAVRPQLTFEDLTAATGGNRYVGDIYGYGYNNAGTPALIAFATIRFRAVDDTSTSEDGAIYFNAYLAGANATRLILDGANATWTNINQILGTAYTEYTERAAPGAGAANTARVYAVVGGDTLTDLAAVFQDGSVDIFAQEVTEPDSPIFQFPDATDLKLTLRKPDRKTVQFVATFPDGRDFVMREIQYPSARWN